MKKIMLTPEIEAKLENMSTDLLTKTVIDYEKYKYDITVRDKAEEILNKRGFFFETEIISKDEPVKSDSNYLYYFVLLLLSVIGYTYFQYKPSYWLSTLSFILFGLIYLFKYYHMNDKK